MKRFSLLVLSSVLSLTVWTLACGGSAPSPESAPADAPVSSPPGGGGETPPAAGAPTESPLPSLEERGGRSRLVAVIRGLAEVGYARPRARREKGEVITTIRVKNLAQGPIAGLKVDEFWYDEAGNTVTGDSYTHREPFMPGEVLDIVLRVPVRPNMNRSNYNFSHRNGDIKATLLDKIEDPAAAQTGQRSS